jgi:hypothetical protein
MSDKQISIHFGNVVAGFSPRRRHCNIVETRAKARDYISNRGSLRC